MRNKLVGAFVRNKKIAVTNNVVSILLLNVLPFILS